VKQILWTLVLISSSISRADQACLDYVKANERNIFQFTTTSIKPGQSPKTGMVKLTDFQRALLCRHSNGEGAGKSAVACMKSIESQLKKTKAPMDEFVNKKWEAYAQLCSGTSDSTAAAKCVESVFLAFPEIDMSGWGAATVCANGARANFAISCLSAAHKYLLDDPSAPEDIGFSDLVDLCINGPKDSKLDSAVIHSRLTCVDPYLKFADSKVSRSTSAIRDESCPADPNPQSKTTAIETPDPRSLDPLARINVCAFDRGPNGLCCARRLIENGKCDDAAAAGVACQSVSSSSEPQTVLWSHIFRCVYNNPAAPESARGVCPEDDEIHSANVQICGSSWGIRPFSSGQTGTAAK
jgi:hypothetical protein